MGAISSRGLKINGLIMVIQYDGRYYTNTDQIHTRCFWTFSSPLSTYRPLIARSELLCELWDIY